MYNGYQRAYHAYCNIKRQYKKALLKEIIARYNKEQPVFDIQQQLKGLPVVEEEIIQAKEYAFIERIWVIQALFTFAILCLKEECRRQLEAINVLTAFYCLQEAGCPCRPKSSASDIRLEQDV